MIITLLIWAVLLSVAVAVGGFLINLAFVALIAVWVGIQTLYEKLFKK